MRHVGGGDSHEGFTWIRGLEGESWTAMWCPLSAGDFLAVGTGNAPKLFFRRTQRKSKEIKDILLLSSIKNRTICLLAECCQQNVHQHSNIFYQDFATINMGVIQEHQTSLRHRDF